MQPERRPSLLLPASRLRWRKDGGDFSRLSKSRGRALPARGDALLPQQPACEEGSPWEDAGRARESRKARGSHAGKAQGVEMPKRSQFEGYFWCRRNQKSGSEGIGETSVAWGSEQAALLQMEERGRGAHGQRLGCAPAQSPGPQGRPQPGPRTLRHLQQHPVRAPGGPSGSSWG